MKEIRCFIFDLDGTLIFNEQANFLAYQAAFQKVGMKLTEEEYGEYFGLGVDDMLKLHTKRHDTPYNEGLLAEVKTHKAKEYADRLHLIELNHAVVGLLKSLAPHYPTALATTAREQNARAVLDKFGLAKFFDFMVFGEQVKSKKPDPECYHKVAEHFGVQPGDCLIFEDSEVGIQAAEAFGAHVCKVMR